MRALDGLTSWYSGWRGLNAVVFGAGATGFSAADTLLELGVQVTVVSSSVTAERADLLEVIGADLLLAPDDGGVPQRLELLDPDVVIVSPGFAPDHPLIAWVMSRGIPIWGDIELAWRLRDKVGPPAEWIAVTGTNGKTTTVQLTTHLLVADGRRAVAVGNIGVPILDAIRDPSGFDVLVVELSSFQLHWLNRSGVGSLAPIASVCLNLAEDHLDWHGSREAYAGAKSVVYANTRIACVYNRADDATRRMVEEADVQSGCRAIGFGLGVPGPSDFGVVDDIIIDRAFLADRHHAAIELTTHGELEAIGMGSPHMVANVLAAAALARAVGIAPEIMRSAIAGFRPDHHRAETIAYARGVRWVDDSKATNLHAADASLRSHDSVVWIVGGLFKGVDIAQLVLSHSSRLKAAVVIGVNREPVVEAFGRHAPEVPVFEVTAADTGQVLPQAVRLAASVASPGDTVLLAPAAASMDQFDDYRDRGDRFVAAVNNFLGGLHDDDESPRDRPHPAGST